ncbi:nucleotide exchange factor GrpE [Porphyromonas sp.]|uniref:nucleotide exchange factor GrpE n=1 Tax=Porphyromonas sp. TaxID=1924944 RepID=UPI0026DCBC94|nr:nucleotide exchange factor GrpE [Porphyromonas sp.]MDO4770819.1 nucleotide exchange factor GrpE [Porphyromonas sp.]
MKANTNENEHKEFAENQEELEKESPECSADTEETDKEAGETDEMTSLQQQYDELKDSYLRLMAEYDNFRKRTLKEKSDLIKSGGERVIKSFLDIWDDLDLAIDNIDSATDMDGVKEGVKLIRTKFETTMGNHGVKEIPTVGEDFDSEKYEAVAMTVAPTPEQKGKIIECVKKGYYLNDKVIVHPMVIVGN